MVGGWFVREMSHLSSKWNRRMNVESQKAMYAARREARGDLTATPLQANPGLKSLPKKAGRKRRRALEFQRLAAKLWTANQGPTGTVNSDGLRRIADELDASSFSKPADYLEGKAACDLKAHNQKFANSPKKLMNWNDLVHRGSPERKLAMRKLLSRCARDIRK